MRNCFSVSEMGCQVCADKITAAVQEIKGVDKVKVDFAAKSMCCDFNPELVTPQQIIDKVIVAGYQAELK